MDWSIVLFSKNGILWKFLISFYVQFFKSLRENFLQMQIQSMGRFRGLASNFVETNLSIFALQSIAYYFLVTTLENSIFLIKFGLHRKWLPYGWIYFRQFLSTLVSAIPKNLFSIV